MKRWSDHLKRFRADTRGASAIEFAVLAPIIIALLLGVMQAGLYMQARNSLHSVTSDMSRYIAVEYQKDNKITNSQVADLAYTRGISTPYLLLGSNLDATAVDASTQSIAKVREIELTMTYNVPDIMPFSPFGDLSLSYTRSIFVTA